MKREYQEFFCEEVRNLWLGLDEVQRPWGVWIRLHLPVCAPDYVLTTDVVSAWFLEEGKLCVRAPSDYVRFHTVHSTRPWYSGGLGFPPVSDIFRQGTHRIGLAGFATVLESEEFYFEYQFGGLFGRGDTYVCDEETILKVFRGVYIS